MKSNLAQPKTVIHREHKVYPIVRKEGLDNKGLLVLCTGSMNGKKWTGMSEVRKGSARHVKYIITQTHSLYFHFNARRHSSIFSFIISNPDFLFLCYKFQFLHYLVSKTWVPGALHFIKHILIGKFFSRLLKWCFSKNLRC
jgi:hypothetical protein